MSSYYSTLSSYGSTAYNATSGYVNSMITRFNDDYRRREEEEEEANEVTPADHLKVEVLELYPRDNAKQHHTDMYDIVHVNPPTTVLRRGQPFFLAMRFQTREYNAELDNVKLVLSFGPKPSVAKGSKVLLVVNKENFTKDKTNWDVRLQHHTGGTITLEIQIPTACPIGAWRLSVETSQKGHPDAKPRIHTCKEDLFILFNPWCKDDTVYMPDPNHRKEYILNEHGKVFVGAYRRTKGRPWVFGQFDDMVLQACIYILELSKLSHIDRGNPIKVVRAISAVVNSSDENGVLEGRWDGEYKDGVQPWMWTGSVKILREYMKNGGKTVKYGQCWVFSGVTTTVCRALGLPARSVTNFVSAHDTNRSLTIDKFFDKSGEEIEGGPDGDCWDSVWNFHVWNDVWMARPDLPPGYGGWQAIDATPQEESEDKMQCGPASLEAIRRGEIGFRYDAPFIFAEVNADVCHFKEDKESDWGYSKIKMLNYHVGRQILSKAPGKDDDDGDDDVDDVTPEYKNTEGSHSERLAVYNAIRGVAKAHDIYDVPDKAADDVAFDLVDIDKIPLGQDFKITLTIHNKSKENRTIQIMLSGRTIRYTGVLAYRVKRAQGEFTVRPGQRETLSLHVSFDEYFPKLVEYCMMKMYAMATVKETKQTWTEEDDFQFEKPKLNIKVRGAMTVGHQASVVFTLTNPLKIALTECEFSFEGPGLQKPKHVDYRDVKPGELISYTQAFTPKLAGTRKIVAVFSSTQMFDVTGSTKTTIKA